MKAQCRKCGKLFMDIWSHVEKDVRNPDGTVSIVYKCERA